MRVIHHGHEERSFDFTAAEILQIARAIAVQTREILIQRIFGVLAERFVTFRGFEFEIVFVFAVLFGHVGHSQCTGFVSLLEPTSQSSK